MITYKGVSYCSCADFILLNQDIIELGENTKGTFIRFSDSTDWETLNVGKLFDVLNKLNENKTIPVTITDVIQTVEIVQSYGTKTRIWDTIEDNATSGGASNG